MAKTSVSDWDASSINNSDIDGINIAENCPAAGINNAIRAVMAHIAAWRDGAIAGLLAKSGGTMTGSITEMGAASTIKDPGGTAQLIGYRNIPSNPRVSSYTLALADVGKCVDTSAGVTIPPNGSVAFTVGDTISIYNNSSSNVTITQGSGVTLRLAGTATTGNRTLAQRGWASVRKLATDEWIASGSGLS